MATDTTKPQVVKRNDAFTGLLAVSFLAMVGACVLLYLEYDQYKDRNPPAMPKIDVPGTLKPAPTAPKDLPKEPPRDQPKGDPMPMEKGGAMIPAPLPSDPVAIQPTKEPMRLPSESIRPTTSPEVAIPIPTIDEAILPVVATEPVKLPMADPVKVPTTTIPQPKTPSVEDGPPIKLKPFVPPM